jgi:prepilin-type N-terminal cleavage/methylation domain-containing protein
MKPSASNRAAFTIVELLVVIAIILVLAALVIAGLPIAKEKARRTSCVNNMRQFGLVLHLYGSDNVEKLPLGYSEQGQVQVARRETSNIDEHVPVITPQIRSNLVQLGGAESFLLCPSLRAPFNRPGGWHFFSYGVLLGFNYLGGHFNSPWSGSGYASASWVSPQKMTDDPQLIVLTDLNTFTFTDKASFIPHTRRGSLFVGGENFGVKPDRGAPENMDGPPDLHPSRFGGAGGNIARLDGGITWRPMKQMKVHIGSSALKEGGALAVW